MKRIILVALFGAFLLLPGTGMAEDVVLRYKPILVQGGVNSTIPPKVLIVDQEHGHIWLWESKGSTMDKRLDADINYQGQLKPGKTKTIKTQTKIVQ